jgi:aspartyl-tRNA(Asn)/glutamyl-tRNA(Gln) amidotransferase subunit B
MTTPTRYEAVIGLEVHAQLKTASKIFCACPTSFGEQPNRNICPVCTGQPGVLPVLNKKAVDLLVTTGLALGCRINRRSIFARKQYFYPDLPKNYQISQYELPLAEAGSLAIMVDGKERVIGIHRIHLEEDAGKLVHAIGSRELDYSLVDLNRTGVPLMEIVSEADLRSPDEAAQYLADLKSILEYLGVSDCNMEEGKFRCDANISVRPVGQEKFGTKAELKNMNSISGVRDALAYEIERQIDLVTAGGTVVQETRLWDVDTGTSHAMRTKEEAHDYRYFPEPDLVPLQISDDVIAAATAALPELPKQRKERLITDLGLPEYDAAVITADKALADFYEEALAAAATSGRQAAAKPLANWLTSELLGRLNAAKLTIAASPVRPQALGDLVSMILAGAISGKIAKTVFAVMMETGSLPAVIVKEKGLTQISDESALARLCQEAVAENQKAAAEFIAGNERAIGALVGAVMKKTKGQANPQLVNKILLSVLRG